MKNKEKKSAESMLNLIDVKRYESSSNYFYRKNKKYMDILQIESSDIFSISDSEMEDINFMFRQLYNLLRSDIKIVCMMFPTDIQSQLAHINKLIDKTTNRAVLSVLEEEKATLENISLEQTNKEFYLFIYADSMNELLEKRREILSAMSKMNGIKEISYSKKETILFKMNNMKS